MTNSVHAVYAIRYAHREAVTRGQNFYGGDPHDGPMPMSYYTWLVVIDGGAVVVDTGFSPEVGAKRPGSRQFFGDQSAVLEQLGHDPAGIRDVVLTHLHFDHAGCTGRFPAARFWLQESEMAFWTGRYAGRASFLHGVEQDDVLDAVRLNFARRIKWVDGDAQLHPGVTLHRVGGHSAGLQVVRVETAAGVVVLASDAAHYYENIEQDRPFNSVHSLPDMYGAFDRVAELAGPDGVIVPGHDPAVVERFPSVENLDGVVVRIA